MRQTPTLFFFLAVSALIATAPASAGDAAKGEEVFVKCVRCHSLDAAGSQEEGPNLHGLFGRKAGTVETYAGYSEALKTSGVVWDEETLDAYLTKPKAFIPGTNMRFRTLSKEEDRQNLIEYLRQATQ
jgi:cytochrome c